MNKAKLTQAMVRSRFYYDEHTGSFVWIARTAQRNVVGKVAGHICEHGYRIIGVLGKHYKAHRLAWLYVHGEWPTQFIDHINGNRDDNRIANLRDVSPSVNFQNQKRAKVQNKTGLLGAHPYRGRFKAQLKSGGRALLLGLYDTPEEAHAAYILAKRIYHEGNTL